MAELQRVIPNATTEAADAGKPSESCVWQYPGGQISLTVAAAPSTPLKDDARARVRDFLDPFKRSAASNVRYEILSGVGDDAIAIVEPSDLSRGIVDDTAMLLVRRRSRQAIAFSAGLSARERGDALRILEQLGGVLAARME